MCWGCGWELQVRAETQQRAAEVQGDLVQKLMEKVQLQARDMQEQVCRRVSVSVGALCAFSWSREGERGIAVLLVSTVDLWCFFVLFCLLIVGSSRGIFCCCVSPPQVQECEELKEYAHLCEERILQLDPNHRLPVSEVVCL